MIPGASAPFSYLAALLRDPAVASVTPSSRFAAGRILNAMSVERARSVVEFGPASGVITGGILERLGPDGVLVAVERNARFARALRRCPDPRLRVAHADARGIDEVLPRMGLSGRVDVVVSGIPFSYLSPAGRARLVGKIRSRLAPDGRFVAYQATPQLLGLLRRHFRRVELSFEVRNLPPLFILTAYP